MSGQPDRTSRILGLIVGLAVGSLFSAAAVGAEAAELSIGSTIVLPILATGALGGWLVGPDAVVAHDRRGWLGLVLGFGLLAVVLGDVIIAAGMLAGSVASPATTIGVSDVGQALLGGLVGAFEIVVIGLIGFGWLALPFTLAASVIWAAVMRRLSMRLRTTG
ncbi:MAG TPA: hypothetical protein VET90_03395 [Candidatus Binatus sp.]|nr:hypothetical protein [Candidatus Binatus sp.]